MFAGATPTFSPAAGTYTAAQSVTLSTATTGATIRYTTDRSSPTPSNAQYTGPIIVNTRTTVSAKAFKAAYADSNVASADMRSINGTLSAPIASPPAGAYTQPQTVTLSGDPGATIRYTIDGSEPMPTSNLYARRLLLGRQVH